MAISEFAILEYRKFDCEKYDKCLYYAAKADRQIVGCEKCQKYVKKQGIRVALQWCKLLRLDNDFNI